MGDGIGLAESLLGLSGFSVVEVTETNAEVVITVETPAGIVGCAECGVRAEAQDRMPVEIRDLACFGRAARLVWQKRRWRCIDADCDARTWTETSCAHLFSRIGEGHRHVLLFVNPARNTPGLMPVVHQVVDPLTSIYTTSRDVPQPGPDGAGTGRQG